MGQIPKKNQSLNFVMSAQKFTQIYIGTKALNTQGEDTLMRDSFFSP